MRALRLARLHTSTSDIRDHLRALLRETAQSVAVVTARLPASESTPPKFHGATLSSFTSIALDPLPLVAFSLRVPSRMASALNADANLVINILSAAQPHLADRFARPDPFADPCAPYTTSQDGLPILSGALGALSCHLVGPSLPLGQLRDAHAFPSGEPQQVSGGTGLASELFIARVLRVEPVHLEEGEENKLPLLYHRRRYTTVGHSNSDGYRSIHSV